MLVFWLLLSNLANRLRTPPAGGTAAMVSADKTGCLAGIEKRDSPSRRSACVRVGEISQRGDLAKWSLEKWSRCLTQRKPCERAV